MIISPDKTIYAYGSSIYIKCEEGYAYGGANRRTCQPGNMWTGKEGTCESKCRIYKMNWKIHLSFARNFIKRYISMYRDVV